MVSLNSQVSGSRSETTTDVHETTMDKTPQNQTAARTPQTNQSPVDQTSSNVTTNKLPTNQTTTKPPQTNQSPVNLSPENKTIDPLQTNQLQFDNLLQNSQSATKGIIKCSSAS